MSLKTDPFLIRRPGAEVMMILEVFEEEGRKVCGIVKVRGAINLKPKAWVAAVREEVTTIENIVRAEGCEEMRIAGRDWSKPLAGLGYEPFPAIPNGLRKVFADGR